MLQSGVRIAFVLAATLVGLTSGTYFYADLDSWQMPPWFGGAMGFGIAVTIVALEHAFRRRFNRSLVAFLVGLAAGLILSWLLISVVHLTVQNEDLRRNLDVPLALVTTYLVLITVLRNADRYRMIVPFAEFRPGGVTEGSVVLDPSALWDARLTGLLEAGLLDQRLLVHRRVISHCEALSAASSAREKLRGQRAIACLGELRRQLGDRLALLDDDIPQATTLADTLVGVCHLEGARLAASDRELLDRARAEGLRVWDIDLLGRRLAPALLPGEILRVAIEREGDNKGQGVGYLDDGSMAVVTGAGDAVGSHVRAAVVRIHHTRNGRMVFADRVADAEHDSSAHRRPGPNPGSAVREGPDGTSR